MDDFQKSGETCKNCEDRWIKAKKHTIKLVSLPTPTARYNAEVAVCPYCDGPIYDLAVAAMNRDDDDDLTTK